MLLHLIRSKNMKSKLNFLKINLFLVIFFTFLYYLEGIYHKHDHTIFNCFYYSLVTQSTVGYGDIIPRDDGLMKHITIMQLLSIFITLSLH